MMIKAIRRNAKSQRTDRVNSGVTAFAVGHHPGHRFDVSPPTAIFFTADDSRNRFQSRILHTHIIGSARMKFHRGNRAAETDVGQAR